MIVSILDMVEGTCQFFVDFLLGHGHELFLSDLGGRSSKSWAPIDHPT